MIKIQNKDLSKILDFKVNRNIKVLGIDTATRTGWCTIDSLGSTSYIDYGFIDIDVKNEGVKYDLMIDFFQKQLDNFKPDVIIIEDTFLRFNVSVLKKLSRFGMIPYVLGKLSERQNQRFFIGPAEARKNIGLTGTAKKKVVHEEFKQKFNLEVDDEDIVDAIILAFNGVIWEDLKK